MSKIAKLETLRKIVDSGLVSIIRAENLEQAERMTDACGLGGIAAVEITYTVPGATKAIEHFAKKFAGHILLGAGRCWIRRRRGLRFWRERNLWCRRH